MDVAPHPDFGRIARIIRRHANLARAWSGEAFRSAEPHYAGTEDIVSGIGSTHAGGRWNPPGSFATVYAALEPETAMSEVLASYRYYGLPLTSAMPRLFRALEIRLAATLDLRNPILTRMLAPWSGQWASEDWRALQESGHESVSQAVGRAVHEAGLEGLLVASAIAGTNIVAFPQRLRSASVLRAL
jgi:RES domain-containing protein